MKTRAKVAWIVLAFFAAETALGALRYLLPKVPFPAPLPNFFSHPHLLALHALGGGLAMLAGPLQLLPTFRERHWKFHRRMGWVYCASVLLGGVMALRLALHAQTGLVASAGFFTLGLAWLASTALALNFILRGNAARHRRWMMRSYSLTAAAITLRIYLPVSMVLHFDYSIAYPVIAWLCWVPNLVFTEFYLRRAPNGSQALQGASAAL